MRIKGRISGLLNNSAGEVNGIILDDQWQVRFSPHHASHVLAIATVGSHVEVEANAPNGFHGKVLIDAAGITNLDSQRCALLQSLPTPNSPEAPAFCPPPGTAGPLAPSYSAREGERPLSEVEVQKAVQIRREVAAEIEKAHGALHRIQATLVCLKIAKEDPFSVSKYLQEAERANVQAVAQYLACEFETARECAEASISLSRVVDILISRACQSRSSQSFAAFPSPVTGYHFKDSAQKGLDRIDQLLLRVRWVTENGTLPSEDVQDARKLSAWTEILCRQTRWLLQTGAEEEAIDFAEAAYAVACSAEHVCKKCYVARLANARSFAAAR